MPPAYCTAHLLVSGHFTEVGAVENKSNHKYYECNHCDNPLKIENRDKKHLLHLSDPSKCPNAPEDVCKAVAQAIQGKKQPITNGESQLILQAHLGNQLEVSKKRKGSGSLQSWVDTALTPVWQNNADIKLFQ